LRRTLADCDLLIIPRYTRLPDGQLITPDLYRLDAAQVAVVKDFLKEGKPVLACLGPANRPPQSPLGGAPPPPREPDNLEQLLAELGIRCPDETVVFDVEDSDDEDGDDLRNIGTARRIPPLDFHSEDVRGSLKRGVRPNPLWLSLHLAGSALGEKQE